MSKKQGMDVYPVFFDLMTGMMFIFIIALIAYMLSFNDKHSEENKLKTQLREITFLRSDLVREVSKQLNRYGIEHQPILEAGVIRLTDPSLQFSSGAWELSNTQLGRVVHLSSALARTVPCYADSQTSSGFFGSNCRKDMSGKLEAIVIEGHTDAVPFSKSNKIIADNMDLSYKRAKSFYNILTERELGRLRNFEGNELLVSSGFGSTRPLEEGIDAAANKKNRRIDIRFQMKANWVN